MQVAAIKRSALWAEGPYEIEYAKVNGKWMFSKMRWYPTYYVPYDKGWDKLEAQTGGASMTTNRHSSRSAAQRRCPALSRRVHSTVPLQESDHREVIYRLIQS